jgi:hypothetical protein
MPWKMPFYKRGKELLHDNAYNSCVSHHPSAVSKRYSTGEPTLSEPVPFRVNMGDYPPYKAAMEFLEADTPRAKQAMNRFESRVPKLPKADLEVYKLIAAVQAALDWSKDDPSTGPPINAAVVEPDTGVRWIRGKSRCGLQNR